MEVPGGRDANRPDSVRNGLASRQTGPSSRESGMMPTQIQTYSQVGAGLRAGDGSPNQAAPSSSARLTSPTAFSSHRTGRTSARPSTGRARPAGAFEVRAGPECREREEGDRHRCRGGVDREPERHRQIATTADPVQRDHERPFDSM